MKEVIKLRDVNSIAYDKFLIATAIRKSTLNDQFKCSLLSSGALRSCEHCELKSICKDIDVVADNYIKETTVSIAEYNFE